MAAPNGSDIDVVLVNALAASVKDRLTSFRTEMLELFSEIKPGAVINEVKTPRVVNRLNVNPAPVNNVVDTTSLEETLASRLDVLSKLFANGIELLSNIADMVQMALATSMNRKPPVAPKRSMTIKHQDGTKSEVQEN